MSTNTDEKDIIDNSVQAGRSRWAFLPVMCFSICFYTAVMAQFAILPQYIFHRLLREKGLPASYSNASVCDINRSDPIYEQRQHVQAESSFVTTKAMLFEGIPSILVVLIFGSYSDEIGRKLTILVPFCGGAILSICLCLLINLDLPFYVYYIGSVCSGLSGSYGTMLSGVFAFLADTTTSDRRSLAMGMMEASLGLSVVVANFAIGYWLKLAGPKSPMIVVTSLMCVSPVFILFMQDSVPDCQVTLYRPQVAFPLRLVYSLKRQFQRIRAVFAADKLRGICLLLIIAAFSLHILCYVGSAGLNTLYVLNKPFCWTSELIGIFSGSKAAFWQLAMFTTVLILRNRVSDWILLVMGFISYTIYNILFASASSFDDPTDNVLLITAAGCGLFNGLCGTMIRTISSKFVVQQEQGVVFATMAGAETVAIVVGAAVLNPMYAVTLWFYKGFAFMFMAMLSLVGVGLVIAAYRVNKRRNHFAILDEHPSVL